MNESITTKTRLINQLKDIYQELNVRFDDVYAEVSENVEQLDLEHQIPVIEECKAIFAQVFNYQKLLNVILDNIQQKCHIATQESETIIDIKNQLTNLIHVNNVPE